MHLRRLGRVFGAESGPDWMVSHAAYPAPVLLASGILRVFFCTRDRENRGHVGWVDLDPSYPTKVLRVSPRPSLSPGSLGAFDDRGISIGSIQSIDGILRLYYLGWNKAADVPFRNSIGMAISDDETGESFSRPYLGPIMDRSRYDPFLLTYPFVEFDESTGYRMYYGTSRFGGNKVAEMKHTLTEAVSEDGIDWSPTGINVLELAEGEYSLSRPWRFNFEGRAFLAFSIRRELYSIGLARWDGETKRWRRTASDWLGPSLEQWESGEASYGAVVQAHGRSLLFYCGRRYGFTGFGVAEILAD